MITWTTYGTWLQGDDRGYVKNAKILPSNAALKNSNKCELSRDPVKLSKYQRKLIRDAIIAKAKMLNHKIYALTVTSNHIHLVLEYTPKPLGRIVSHYKNYALFALRSQGFKGRLWTKGYNKIYCFEHRSLKKRIAYVLAHND